MKEENTAGFILRLRAKEQAGIELGSLEREYLKAVTRVKKREGKR